MQLVKRLMLAAPLALAVAVPASAMNIIASTDFDSAKNLNSVTGSPAFNSFSSAADGWGVYQRGVSPTIPFALLDDSAGSFPPDDQGIIKTGKTDRWFGVADTDNGDNPGGDVNAIWEFDTSSAGGGTLAVSMLMGAMGNFEPSDIFNWLYSYNGSTYNPLFTSSVDDSGSYTYTLESGTMVTEIDPLLMNGVLVNNNLTKFTAIIDGPSSDTFYLQFVGNTNGSDEAYAFDEIEIAVIPEPGSIFLLGLGGAAVAARRRKKAA